MANFGYVCTAEDIAMIEAQRTWHNKEHRDRHGRSARPVYGMPAGGWPAMNWNGARNWPPPPRGYLQVGEARKKRTAMPDGYGGWFDYTPAGMIYNYMTTSSDPLVAQAQAQQAAYEQQKLLAQQRAAALQSLLTSTGQYKPPAGITMMPTQSPIVQPYIPVPQAMESYRPVGVENIMPAGPQGLPVPADYSQYVLPGVLAGAALLLVLGLVATGRKRAPAPAAALSNPRRNRRRSRR